MSDYIGEMEVTSHRCRTIFASERVGYGLAELAGAETGWGHGVLGASMSRLAYPRLMATFDPNRRCRLHGQLNDEIGVWAPITLEEWRRRMKWNDAGETVMDWDGLLYDGWESVTELS